MNRNTTVILAAGALVLGVGVYVARRSPGPAVADPSVAPAAASAATSGSGPAPSAAAATSAAAGDDTAAAHAEAGALTRSDGDGGSPGTAFAIGGGHGDGDGGSDPGVVSVDEKHSGATIPLARAQKLVIALPANPTTGFDWVVLKAPAGLGKAEVSSVAGTGEGGGGARRFTFTPKEALPAGEHAVELGYQRGFEPGSAPLKTFRFKVRPGS